MTCPASLVLPRPETARREKTQRAADLGTLLHYWKETGDTDPPGADPRDVDTAEKKVLLSSIDRDEWWHHGEHEVAFAIHLTTLEVQRFVRCDCGEPHTRPADDPDAWKKSFGKEWLTGTIDYLRDDLGGDDLKTGSWDVEAKGNRQLLSYALLTWVEAGCPTKWEKWWSITTWKKYPLAGLPKRSWWLITGMDLLDHLEDLRWAVSNPSEVNVVDSLCGHCGGWGHSSYACQYEYEAGYEDELSPCLFCPCREAHPVSSWMTHWLFARFPACLPGLASTAEKYEEQP